MNVGPTSCLCYSLASNVEGDIDLFDECLYRDDEIISERLRTLFGLLKELESL